MFSTSCPDLSKVMIGEFRYGTARVRGAYETPDDAYLIVNTDIFEGLLHNGTAVYEQEQDYGVIKGLYGKRIIEEYLAEQERLRLERIQNNKRTRINNANKARAFKKECVKKDILKAVLQGYLIQDIITLTGLSRSEVYKLVADLNVDFVKYIYPDSKGIDIPKEDVEQFINLDCNYKKYRKYLGDRCASLGANGVSPVIEDLPAEMVEELTPENLSSLEEAEVDWDSWDTVEEVTPEPSEDIDWDDWGAEDKDKQACIDYLNAVAEEDDDCVETGYTEEESMEDDPWGEEDFKTVVEYEHEEETGFGVSDEIPKEVVDNDVEIKNYVSCKDKEIEVEETTELPEYLQKASEPEVLDSSYYSDNFSKVNGKLMPKLQPKTRS